MSRTQRVIRFPIRKSHPQILIDSTEDDLIRYIFMASFRDNGRNDDASGDLFSLVLVDELGEVELSPLSSVDMSTDLSISTLSFHDANSIGDAMRKNPDE
jgi:hypothetical protein